MSPQPAPLGEQCFGLHQRTVLRVATGFASTAAADGGLAAGPADISFHGRGNGYVVIGTQRDRAAFGPQASGLAQLARLRVQRRAGQREGDAARASVDEAGARSHHRASLPMPTVVRGTVQKRSRGSHG